MHSSPAVPTGTGLQVRIDDVDLGVRDRLADRDERQVARRIARPPCHIDGRLGGAVQVVELGRQPLEESVLERLGQRLAAADDPREAGAVGGPRVLQEQLQHRRHEVDRGDPAIDDDLREVGAVAVAAGLRDHELRAEPERPEELPDRHIEAERRLLEDAVGRGQPEGLLHPHEAIGDRAVGDHRALRLARGARRIDDVGEVIERRAGGDVGRLAIGDGIGHAVHRHDLGRAAHKPPGEAPAG